MSVRTIIPPTVTLGLLVVLLFGVGASPAHAQPGRMGDAFYGKLGGGISDYTGDFPAGTTSHPLDFQEFGDGSGLPFTVTGEFGYQFSPSWALAVGVQAGNYPMVGYAGIGGISDSYRVAPQLLGRYTFGPPGQPVAPYIDVGVNATFGGDSPPTSPGFGPSVGAGLDILLSREASFFVESRFNATVPDDAVDGAGTGERFDLTGQLLGFGLKVTFTTPTPPRILQLDGPPEVKAGSSVAFAATINEAEAGRPVDYQWDFGDGTVGAGLTATHTYDRPGTYEVSFSASNEAGKASQSLTVVATRPPKPPEIASISAAPDSVAVGTPVQFSGTAAGSGALAYEWRFGDGTSGTGPSPTHTYETPGVHAVRLRVSNKAGAESRTVTVRVARRAKQTQADKQQPAPKQAGQKQGAQPQNDQKPAAPTQEQEERWGIVVASTREAGTAEAVGRQYQALFSESVPTETVVTETDRGRRYRVVVGEYEDADRARQALEKRSTDLPSGAWLLSRTVAPTDAGRTEEAAKQTSENQTPPEQPDQNQEVQEQGERWGIVVVSAREESRARTVARQYQERFSESMPVDIVTAETDQGRRYRVVVGDLADADAGRQALQAHSEILPSGAWLLRVE